MKLSILIAALDSRDWRKIYGKLLKQTFNNREVEVLVCCDDGTRTSGSKRNDLTSRSSGEYIAFVDDDDEVSPNYIKRLLEGCNSGADVVSFAMEFRNTSGRRKKPEIWKLGLYPNLRQKGLMSINHLCAWRRTLATRVAWCEELGYADDQLWLQPLLHSGLIKTCWVINEVLYYYLYSPEVTENQKRERIEKAKKYVDDGLDCYFDSFGEILIETPTGSPRNRYGVVVDTPNLTKFHKITIE